MKIFIADDEYFTRKGLARRIQTWDPNAVILEFENGRQAWEMIEKDTPDILFADIRMPEMDGLALAEQIHTLFPDLKTVIISGFAEFSYAKQALLSGVKEYLLKPIDREELFRLLQNVYEEIHQAAFRKEEELCNRLIYREATVPGEAPLLLPQGSFYNIIVIQSDSQSCESIESMLRNLELGTLPIKLRIFSSHRYHNEKIIMVSSMAPASDEDLYNMHIDLVKAAFLKAIRSTTSSLSAGISIKTNEPNPRKAYWEAKQELNARLFEGWNKVITYEALRQRCKYRLDYVEDVSSVFFHKLIQGKGDDAKQIVSAVFARLAEDRSCSVQCLQDTLGKHIMILNEAFEYFNQQNPGIQHLYLEQKELSEFYSLQQIIGFLHEAIDEMEKFFTSSEQKNTIVDELKNLIKSHYFQDIVLDEIAKHHYYVAPSYLSRLFKSQTGENFSEYLLSVRMQKAKEMLLANHRLAVKDIANAVGYNDCSYFVQLFKRFYGETPGKYREMLKSEA